MAKDFSFIHTFEVPNPEEGFVIAVGASYLSKVFPEYDGSWLLGHQPSWVVSGNELHEFTPRSLLHYLESAPPMTCPQSKLLVEKTLPLDPTRTYLKITAGTPETLALIHPGDQVSELTPGTLLVSEVCVNWPL